MISCLWLERPGWWRSAGIAVLVLLAALPSVPLLWQTLASSGPDALDRAFALALGNSVALGVLVAAVAFALGLPAGAVTALYEFPGRRMLLALAALPLLVPTFLWAIGWSALAARLGPTASNAVSGQAGCVLVFLAGGFPLVLLTTHAAAAAVLTGSQVDAARVAGGERAVLLQTWRHAAVPAGLAAALAGVLTLSDPGPGQILGLRTAASEILTSFAARYDFALAGRQCVVLAAAVLLAAVPLAWLAAPRLASEILPRQSGALRRHNSRAASMVAVPVAVSLLLVLLAAPVVGLLLPLGDNPEWGRAWREVSRTGSNTLTYSVGAGSIATTLGLFLALAVGRSQRLRTWSLGLGLVLFSLPPALTALGIVQLAAASPAWADLVLRSRGTVCLVLGLRFFPVAAILGLRAWGSMSSTLTLAAAVQGVPLARYLGRVVGPLVLPATAISMLLVALLATAEVGTVLLVHPPGEASLPLAIFTIMANAPQSLVATLCLVYLGLAGGLLTAAWSIAGRWRP